MHEAGLALAVLDIVEQEAERHGAERIGRVRLAVGPFAGLEWETFASFFARAALGGVAEGASLERESAPALAVCRNCAREFELHDMHDRCPGCGSDELESLAGGRTFAVVAMEAV
jgi:hydrogenase nickel incorporation protein HypA/HybF